MRAAWARSCALNCAWPPGRRAKTTSQAGDGVREVGAVVLVDEGQEQVHAGGHARGRPPVAVPDVDPVGLQVEVGVAVGERRRRGPVRGRLVAVEQSGGGEEPRAGAHRRHPPGARGHGREVVDERAVAACRPRPVAAHDDERVDRLGAGGGRVQHDVRRDEDAALRADPTPRRRHPGGVRRVGAEPGGAAEHLDGTGEVEELEVVEGHEQHLVRRTHGRIIRARPAGSKSKYLTIPATSQAAAGRRARSSLVEVVGPGEVTGGSRRADAGSRCRRARRCSAGPS